MNDTERAASPGRVIVRLLASGGALLGIGWGAGEFVETFAAGPDLRIARSLEGTPPAVTSVMRAASALGGLPVLAVLAFVSLFVFARTSLRKSAIWLAGVFIGEEIVVRILKTLVARPRPPVAALVASTGLSFPSGHAARATALYGAMALLWTRRNTTRRRPVWIAAVVVVLLVSASRVVLGVHYPTDVLGGAALGIMWLWAADAGFRAG